MWHSCVWKKEKKMGCIHKLRTHKRTLTKDLNELNLRKSWKKYDMSKSLQNKCQVNYIAKSMKFELIDSYLDQFVAYLVYEHHARVFFSLQVWLPRFFLCWSSHMFFFPQTNLPEFKLSMFCLLPWWIKYVVLQLHNCENSLSFCVDYVW